MTEDHPLVVFDEAPLVGRVANIEAWRGYVERFPDYRIHPHEIAEQGATVAILGHTTGSHLAVPDEEERQIAVLWRAEIAGAQVRRWTVTDPP
jgi:hypothetical protein